jgi:cell division inhibitor SepF
MSIWKKTMDYLGLGPDDAYDDYDERDADAAPRGRTGRDDGRSSRGSKGSQWPAEPDDPAVRAVPARPSFPSRDFESPTRRAVPGPDDSGSQSRAQQRQPSPRVTTTPVGAEPATVRPRRFDQAQELADKFKEGQPVILNLEATERDVARRLIDFASGICYGLDGSMEKVATGVYLLKPAPLRVHRFDDYES